MNAWNMLKQNHPEVFRRFAVLFQKVGFVRGVFLRQTYISPEGGEIRLTNIKVQAKVILSRFRQISGGIRGELEGRRGGASFLGWNVRQRKEISAR